MTDYSELVNALRSASTVSTAWEKLMLDAAAAIEALQAAEPTEKQVVEYCNKRCFVVLGADLFHELKASYGKLPKRGEIVRCGECRYWDGHCDEVMEGRGTDPDWFCAGGERKVQE